MEHASEIIGAISNIPNMRDAMIIALLTAGIRIGILGDGEINNKERSLIKTFEFED